MTVPSSWRLSEPQETVAKALVRAAKVGEERIALCVAKWYGWEFPDCGKATAIPPVDAGQASWFVTSLFFQYFLFISKYRRLSTECPIGGVKNDIIWEKRPSKSPYVEPSGSHADTVKDSDTTYRPFERGVMLLPILFVMQKILSPH